MLDRKKRFGIARRVRKSGTSKMRSNVKSYSKRRRK